MLAVFIHLHACLGYQNQVGQEAYFQEVAWMDPKAVEPVEVGAGGDVEEAYDGAGQEGGHPCEDDALEDDASGGHGDYVLVVEHGAVVAVGAVATETVATAIAEAAG